jgi:hypothetical protein
MVPSILDCIICVLLGILAVPNLIIAKRPDAKQLIDRIAPFQGWIGVFALAWGIWRIIALILYLGTVIEWLTMKQGIIWMLFGVSYIAYTLVLTVLGFLLGFGTMKSFIKNPQAIARMDQTLARLGPKQGTFGVIALINGAAMLVLYIIR